MLCAPGGADCTAVCSPLATARAALCVCDGSICTASADFDINPYLAAVKAQGCFCCVGLPPNELRVKPFQFIARRIRIGAQPTGFS